MQLATWHAAHVGVAGRNLPFAGLQVERSIKQRREVSREAGIGPARYERNVLDQLIIPESLLAARGTVARGPKPGRGQTHVTRRRPRCSRCAPIGPDPVTI